MRYPQIDHLEEGYVHNLIFRTVEFPTSKVASFIFLFAQPPELTEDQRQELREAFELFDADKKGSIDLHELKVLMRALGFNVKKNDVLKYVHNVDPHNEGNVNFDKFMDLSRCYFQIWFLTIAKSLMSAFCGYLSPLLYAQWLTDIRRGILMRRS